MIEDTAERRLARARIAAAQALLDLGRVEEAITETAEAARLAPGLAAAIHVQALLARGAARARAGDPRAADDFTAALRAAPSPWLRDLAALLVGAYAHPGATAGTPARAEAPHSVPAIRLNTTVHHISASSHTPTNGIHHAPSAPLEPPEPAAG